MMTRAHSPKSKFLNELKTSLAASPVRTSSIDKAEITLKVTPKDDPSNQPIQQSEINAGETSSTTEDDKMLELKPQPIEKNITIINNKQN